MKIWLDDIRQAPHGFIHVKNLAELKALLTAQSEPIEIMSFDHDLGEDTPSGYEIIKWLAEHHLDRWPKEIQVHSANPVGRDNILAFADFIRRRILT